jgi:hypothetical protein
LLAAKAWKRRAHPNVHFERLPGQGAHRLDCYLDLIGYKLPTYFGDRQAAGRISYARTQLGRRNGDFNRLTAAAKAKWTKVLDGTTAAACARSCSTPQRPRSRAYERRRYNSRTKSLHDTELLLLTGSLHVHNCCGNAGR